MKYYILLLLWSISLIGMENTKPKSHKENKSNPYKKILEKRVAEIKINEKIYIGWHRKEVEDSDPIFTDWVAALEEGNDAEAIALIKAGLPLCAHFKGRTPLGWAVHYDRTRVVKSLSKYNAPPLLEHVLSYEFPVSFECKGREYSEKLIRNPRILAIFLENKWINPNARVSWRSGRTILVDAIDANQNEAVSILLEQGADQNALFLTESGNEVTPLVLAKNKSLSKIVSLLEKYQACEISNPVKNTTASEYAYNKGYITHKQFRHMTLSM